MVKSLWGCPSADWVVLDAIHADGGVLMMWDRRVFVKVDYVVGRFSVSILLKGVANGFEWLYGPTDESLRDAMWAKLDTMRSWIHGGFWLGVCLVISILSDVWQTWMYFV